MFRRRRRDELPPDDAEPTTDELPPEGAESPEGELAGRQGPWDAADVPADDLARLDLGALLVPVYDDMEVRVEVSADHQVMTATLVEAGSALQVSAFAAPRREGIWPDVRAEIAASVRDAGGSSDEVEGPFGPELLARVPTGSRGQKLEPARFLGIDGPRWFLRGVLTGAAATDPGRATRFEEAFRQLVVVRGGEAMAPRDPLPLRLPKEASQADSPARGLDPFERGPEITEVR